MMPCLAGQVLALLPAVTPSSLRDFAVALCVLTFLLGFVLWFIRYVRVERPESGVGEG